MAARLLTYLLVVTVSAQNQPMPVLLYTVLYGNFESGLHEPPAGLLEDLGGVECICFADSQSAAKIILKPDSIWRVEVVELVGSRTLNYGHLTGPDRVLANVIMARYLPFELFPEGKYETAVYVHANAFLQDRGTLRSMVLHGWEVGAEVVMSEHGFRHSVYADIEVASREGYKGWNLEFDRIRRFYEDAGMPSNTGMLWDGLIVYCKPFGAGTRLLGQRLVSDLLAASFVEHTRLPHKPLVATALAFALWQLGALPFDRQGWPNAHAQVAVAPYKTVCNEGVGYHGSLATKHRDRSMTKLLPNQTQTSRDLELLQNECEQCREQPLCQHRLVLEWEHNITWWCPLQECDHLHDVILYEDGRVIDRARVNDAYRRVSSEMYTGFEASGFGAVDDDSEDSEVALCSGQLRVWSGIRMPATYTLVFVDREDRPVERLVHDLPCSSNAFKNAAMRVDLRLDTPTESFDLTQWPGFLRHYKPNTYEEYIVCQVNSGIFDDVLRESQLRATDPQLVIVDMGANIGLATLYLQAFASKVVAVEPLSPHYDAITDMIRVFGLHHVVAIRAAVVAETGSGFVNFWRDAQNPTGSALASLKPDGDTDNVYQVPALTPRMVLALHGLTRVDLLKLDIEGGEEMILDQLAELDIGCIHMECHFAGCLEAAKAAWRGKLELVSKSEFGTVQDDSLWCTPHNPT